MVSRVVATGLVAAALLGACDDDRGRDVSSAVTPSLAPTTESVPVDIRPQAGLPSEVAEVRARIIDAAERKDYELLMPVLDPDVFLSDFGFGVDPVSRWESTGSEPLELMGALLRMPFEKEKSNEGILYRWPVYDPDSSARDLRSRDRRLFLEVMSRKELSNQFGYEYGYVGPRLGILRDGTWWFFVAEGGP